MHNRLKYYLKSLIIVLDLLIFNITFFITLHIFNGADRFETFNSYLIFWISLNSSWVILCLIFGVYGSVTILTFEVFIKRTAQVYILWILTTLFYLFISRSIYFSRLFVLLTLLNFAIVLLVNRFFYFGLKRYLKVHHDFINKVIILGFNDTAKKIAAYFEEEGLNNKLLGFVEDEKNINELTNYPILANFDNLITIAKKLDVQEIFSTISPEQNKMIYSLMTDAENKCLRFKIIPDLSVFFNKPYVIDYLKDMPVLSLRIDPMEDVGNRFKKRLLDIVVSSLVIILILSWLIPLIGLVILLESKGPIFFSQLRTGKNDKPFMCLKFRSMKVDNDCESRQATKHDIRVTRIGSFLRKSSLDEFPQFINVFKGEMSLVGPRPHMVIHTSEFSKIVDHYMIRQFLKPGITGWAQINNYRGEITDPIQLKNRVLCDLWYLENWNIWLDIRIIYLTIYQVFSGSSNAY